LTKYFFIILICLSVTSANAQNARLDNLKRSLASAKEDTSKVLLLADISLWSIFSNPDSSLHWAQEGIKLAQQINYTKGEAYCNRSSGFYFWSIGDYSTAIKIAFLGMAYAEAAKDFGLQIWLINLLKNAYRDNGDYNEALKYDLKSKKLNQNLNGTVDGKDYAITASIYYGLNKLDSALHYMHLSLQLLSPDGWTCMVMGRLQAKRNRADSAFYYFKESIQKLSDEHNFKELASSYQSIAALYHSLGNWDSVIYYAQEGLAIARQKAFAKEQFELSSLLAYVYEKKNTDSALLYYKIAMSAKDSLFSREKAKQILSFQFNEEFRQREIKRTEMEYKNKVRTYGFLAGLILLIVISILLWRNNRQKQHAYNILQMQKAKTDQALADLKATQSQLIQSEKMASLGELTAGIAHEIQNPLNFVKNFSELNTELLFEMKDEIVKGDLDEVKAIANNVIDNQKKINHHGLRADAIVKGMLQHSRASTGEKELTNINALADEYLRLSYHGLSAKDKLFNATLKTEFDESIGSINIITQDIGRVLLNLYNNAFYAVNEKKKESNGLFEPLVEVTTKKQDDTLILSIRDNGSGIPQKVIDKIFQPFFTTKPAGNGTGLGLSLSYDIIKAHGGELKVKTHEGEGAEFIIELPLA
jgi:signal transduction histidine kinase